MLKKKKNKKQNCFNRPIMSCAIYIYIPYNGVRENTRESQNEAMEMERFLRVVALLRMPMISIFKNINSPSF